MYKIATIPGDGTGPEVVREGLKVLEAAGQKYGFKYELVNYDLGGERYLKTGEILPDSVIEDLKKCNTIFLGAIGHPDVQPGNPGKRLASESKICVTAVHKPTSCKVVSGRRLSAQG